ncbi:MAG: ATP-binding protein, partial [Acidobacteriota bacterium]
PLRDASGAIEGILLHGVDVTERKRAEEKLREADRRKDEFLAMLAHELRNPLAPITNAIQVFRGKGPPEPEFQWATEVIDRQVHQMTRLIDDLLDVSRITRGKIELRKERVDLSSVVKSAVEASQPLITKRGHVLNVTIPLRTIRLNADPTRLAQVLLNLLNNAAKYTNQGGRIWVSTDVEGDHVLIRVKDTGIGIPAEMVPKIFDLFTQVDGSSERSEGGLGIGLTLVKNLVEMHDGTVDVRSTGVGHGSEFMVRLPILVETPSAASADQNVPAQASAAARRILVVDDNQDSAESLAMVLKIGGNETHIAYDGLEAVEAAEVFRPDVILLDIGLPKLNGYDAARRIRAETWGKSMVLVALTGWGQDEDRQKSREAGFNAHVVKPVDHAVLTTLLASLSKP